MTIDYRVRKGSVIIDKDWGTSPEIILVMENKDLAQLDKESIVSVFSF